MFIKAEKMRCFKNYSKYFPFFQKNSKSYGQKQFAAHLEGTHGTLVENHCARVMDYPVLDKSIII